MFVSEVNNYHSKNINFGARTFNVIKFVRSKEAVVQLQGDVPSQVVTLVNVVNKLHDSLRKLGVQKSNEQAQNCLEVLKTKHGLRGVFETPTDGIVLAAKDDKNLIVSSHGVNSLRLREQNANTGEIESSIFIHDKKVVKNDTKHEIPEKFEYLKNADIGYQFGTDLQTKLDDADFALLKVRRALSAPEFQAEINKVDEAFKIRAISAPTPKSSPAPKVEKEPKVVVQTELQEKSNPVRKTLSPSRIEMIRARLNAVDLPKVEKAPEKKVEPQVGVKKPKRAYNSSLRVLSDEDMGKVKDVKSAFLQAYNTLNSQNLSVNTRSTIKNGYENIIKGEAGSRRLTFDGIGPQGSSVGVNFATFQGYEFMQIRLTDKNGKIQDLIVNEKGKVSATTAAFKDKVAMAMKSKTYTRQELDELDFIPMLGRLKNELGEYTKYLETRLNKTSDWKQRQVNPENIGSLDAEESLLNSLYEGFNNYKTNFKKVLFQNRAKLLAEIGFETKRGNPSILMRGVGENSENIHLSFPVLKGKRATKIQLLGENDNIKQVFYILDNKLVRFNADDIHSAVRDDRKLRYYSEEDIENLGVRKYLSVVNEHLQKVNATVQNFKPKGRVAKAEQQKPEKPVKIAKHPEVKDSEILLQLQAQLNQLRSDLNHELKFLMSDFVNATTKAFKDFENNANKKINDFQEKLGQLLKK